MYLGGLGFSYPQQELTVFVCFMAKKKEKKEREREIARLVCLFVLEGFGSARKC